MRNSWIGVSALVLGACGDEIPAPATPPPAHEMPMEAKAAQRSSYDQRYIDGMVPHHEGAVEMAKIARERGQHPEIKAMAEAMISAQQAEIDQMKTWRQAWFGSAEIPPMAHAKGKAMHDMEAMRADIEKLKTADPFDLAFLDAMIPHHRGAIEMSQNAPEKGEKQEIKDLAAKISADQRKEIAQMREWRKAWYPDAPPMQVE